MQSVQTPNISNKLARAKARLLLSSPYFGTLASRLKLEASENIPGFLSDGLALDFNPDYVNDLSNQECEFMLANGAMHAALIHERRQLGRMGWLWQLATDHAINAILVQNGFAMPPQVNFEPRFEGMYAEQIYAELKEEIKNEAYNEDETNDTGFNENHQRKREIRDQASQPNDATASRPQLEGETHLDESLFNAFEKSLREQLDRQGNTPLGLERLFVPTKVTHIDWRSELANALNHHLMRDYRVLPPSKKLLYEHIYLPASTSQTLELVIALDSSGSIDEKLLGDFIAETESLLETFSDYRIHLLVSDAKIQSHQEFYPGEPITFRLKGGGGTDFRPVFEWVKLFVPETVLLLYFTDLDGRFPDITPVHETLWLTASNKVAPLGKTVIITA